MPRRISHNGTRRSSISVQVVVRSGSRGLRALCKFFRSSLIRTSTAFVAAVEHSYDSVEVSSKEAVYQVGVSLVGRANEIKQLDALLLVRQSGIRENYGI